MGVRTLLLLGDAKALSNRTKERSHAAWPPCPRRHQRLGALERGAGAAGRSVSAFYQPFYKIVRATLPPWGAGAPSLESSSIALTAPIRINNHTYQPPVYLYCTYLPSTRIGRKFTLPSIAARSRNRQATCALRRESTRAPPQRLPAWRSRATFRRRLASG